MAVSMKVIEVIARSVAKTARVGPQNKAAVEFLMSDLAESAHGTSKELERVVRNLRTAVKAINEGD